MRWRSLSVFLSTVCHAAKEGRLIVHVGLHKTSTTSTQQYLYARRAQLERTYSHLRVAAATHIKSGAFIPITMMSEGQCGGQGSSTFDNPKTVEKQIGEVRGWLREGKTVLLSGEAFDRVSARCLKQFVDETGARDSIGVVVLREPTSWLRSHWQVVMRRMDHQSFQAWLMEEHDVNVASPFTTIQNVKEAFDETEIISYEYLLQHEHTVASYLICNTSLHLTNSNDWRQCTRDVDKNVLRSNPSSPAIQDDLFRYVETARKILGCPRRKKKSVTNKAASKLLESLPTTCNKYANKATDNTTFATASNSYFGHIFQESWDSWLRYDLQIKAPVHSLSYTPSPICIIDDSRLTPQHWADIVSLHLPECASETHA